MRYNTVHAENNRDASSSDKAEAHTLENHLSQGTLKYVRVSKDKKPFAIAKNNNNIEQLEAFGLNQPQIECPMVHRFGPGIYVREMSIPAGTLVVGRIHKHEHMNMMMKGKLVLLGDGPAQEISAPFTKTTPPGQKIVYTLEDTVWMNIYATDETDVDKLESMLFELDETAEAYFRALHEYNTLNREKERQDFTSFCTENNITEDEFNNKNIKTFPLEDRWLSQITRRDSPIQGKGVFSACGFVEGQIITPVILNNNYTDIVKYINHSSTPNSKLINIENDVYLSAVQKIDGCRGGDNGEEITIDYRELYKVVK